MTSPRARRSFEPNKLLDVGPVASTGGNVLVKGDADEVLQSLGTAAVQPRLFLNDPPYNRRTRFHHYSDSQPRSDWLSERTRQVRLMRDLLTEDGSLSRFCQYPR